MWWHACRGLRCRFIWEQIIGFVVLVFGTFMYNEVFHLSFIPFLRPPPPDLEENTQDETEPLLNPVSDRSTTIQTEI